MTVEESAKLQRWIDSQQSAVRCLFAEEPDALPEVLESLAGNGRTFTVVSIESQPEDALAEHLEGLVQVMADAVLMQYPELYATSFAQLHSRWIQTETQLAIERVTHADARVSAGWLKRTLEACREGRSPRHHGYTLAVEAEQLALCLDPLRLVIGWVVPAGEVPAARLLGLARAAEWLRVSTGALVLVALDIRWRGRRELDSISYDALELCGGVATDDLDSAKPRENDAGGSAPEPDEAAAGGSETRRPGRREMTRDNARSPSVKGLWPFVGRPHPLSPAELAFATVLARDAELAPKFAWNQVVHTAQDTRPIVDLLWSDQHLVVEIDGYSHHSSRVAFERDRQRDWELLVSGYRVLRIPATEVLRNAAASLEKLRVLTRTLDGR